MPGAAVEIALPLFVMMTAFASVKFRWGPSLALAGFWFSPSEEFGGSDILIDCLRIEAPRAR